MGMSDDLKKKLRYTTIILIVGIVCVLGVTYYLNSRDRYLFIFTVNQKIMVHFLWMILFVCTYMLVQPKFQWRVYVLYSFLGICVLVNGAFFIWHCRRAKDEYFVFTSPNKTNTCVIQEQSHTSYFYKDTMFTIKRLKVDMSGNSIRSFRDGRYSVSWPSEETVFVSYLLMGPDRYFDVLINLTEPELLFSGEIVKKDGVASD